MTKLLRLIQAKWILKSFDGKSRPLRLPLEHLGHILSLGESFWPEHEHILDLFDLGVDHDGTSAPLLDRIEQIHVLLGAQ